MSFGFRLFFADKTVFVSAESLVGKEEGNKTIYAAEISGVQIVWCIESVETGMLITLTADSDKPLRLKRVDSFVFSVDSMRATDRILFFGNKLSCSTHRYPCDLAEDTEYSADCTGLFGDLSENGTVLAMVAPFTNIVGAGVKKVNGQLEYFAKTEYTDGMLEAHSLVAEKAWR